MKKTYTPEKLTVEYIRACTTHAVAKTLEVKGGIPPIFICYGRDRMVNLVASQLADDEVKDQFVSTLRHICIAEDAFAAVLVLESWISPACTEKTGIRPSLASDRQEFVVVQIEFPGNQGEMNQYPIIRDANGKPSLGACSISQPIKDCTGRFANFMPATPPTEGERIIAQCLAQRNMQLMKVYPAKGN